MEADIQKNFDAINSRFDELMIFLRDNMVTKEDLGVEVTRLENKIDTDIARLENKMDSGFARVDSELLRLENKMDENFFLCRQK